MPQSFPYPTPLQGSAADLAKAAMIAIHTALARQLPPGSARLVLQIHDEFLLEVAGGCCVDCCMFCLLPGGAS